MRWILLVATASPALAEPRVHASAEVERDAAVAVRAEARAYNREGMPASLLHVTFDRAFGAVRVAADGAVGSGVDDDERFGEATIAVLRGRVGLAASGHVDLERDDDEPTEEIDWELTAGPLVTHRGLYLQAGVTTWQLRGDDTRYTGVFAGAGVRRAF